MKEIGRILLPGDREHLVYPPRPVLPPPPPEQIITFPDKKEYHVDWRANLRKLAEVSDIIESAEIVQEEGTYRVPLSNPEVPYAIGFVFSDAHVGPYTTDHRIIIDIMDTILTTPNAFLVDAGDTFNNGIWGGLGYEDIMPPYMQTFTVEDMMREMGERWGATVIGNHPEWMFSAAGMQPEQVFARKVKGPIFPGMGLLHLEAGKQKYDWALAHNYWGKSKKNIFNVCVNLRQTEYPQADIFTVGHEHIWGYMKEKCDGREVLYVRPGTAKLKDRYARIHGIAKRGQECGIAVVFGTGDKREFNAYPIDDAVDLVNLRKELTRYEINAAEASKL